MDEQRGLFAEICRTSKGQQATMTFAINRTIGDIPHFQALLGEHPRAIAGWGRKRSGRWAVALARLTPWPFVLLEDGFLRSVTRTEPPRSLLIDPVGVYYDATRPSLMEQVIAAGVTAGEASRARDIAAAWCTAGLSKYNHAPHFAGTLPEKYVLVADQCFGDLSVVSGMADAASFATMIAAAKDENPDCTVLVKVHPDVVSGRREGYIPGTALTDPRMRIISADCHPLRLIAGAQAVYSVTSLLGFEALLHGKRVRCFGMPFYAGWGVTEDALERPPRRRTARLEALVHAAFVAVPRYADPASGAVWDVEAAIADAARARAELLASFGEAEHRRDGSL
jgi:capsule polysaccharide export protein KpsC/LpsZ